jgi:thioredoxin-like negative regulator of GroEL
VVSRGSKPAARPRPEPAAPLEANAAPTADPSTEPDSGSRAEAHEQPSRSVAAVPSADQWKRAARGLRDGDFQSANAALRELTRRGTEEDRESALLVQAQVLLAQGRDAEAGSLLKSLAASAHAPSVRRKSTELLARLRERPAQPRSGSDLR